MNDKTVGGHGGDSPPDLIFVESVLREAGIENTTILPITDPYVVHHGALGTRVDCLASEPCKQFTNSRQWLIIEAVASCSTGSFATVHLADAS
eukprot:SAG11_NODE_10065_length_859_cov_1.247368_2_plen_92_part_01